MKIATSFMVIVCFVMSSTVVLAEARSPQLVITAFVEALQQNDLEHLNKYTDLDKIKKQPRHGYTVETLKNIFSNVLLKQIELSELSYDVKTKIIKVSMIKPLSFDFELQHQNTLIKPKGDFYRIIGIHP